MATPFKPEPNIEYDIIIDSEPKAMRSRYPEDMPEEERKMQYGYYVKIQGEDYAWYASAFCHDQLQNAGAIKGDQFTVTKRETEDGIRWSIIPGQVRDKRTTHLAPPGAPYVASKDRHSTPLSTSTRETLAALERIWVNCQEASNKYFEKLTEHNVKLAHTFYQELRNMGFNDWKEIEEPVEIEPAATNITPIPVENTSTVEDDDLPF